MVLNSGVASMRAECVISHGLLESSNVQTLQYLMDFFGWLVLKQCKYNINLTKIND
jgi:hypothetical protein